VYLLRCTARLLADGGRHLPWTSAADVSDTSLGDWFANRLAAGRQRYVIATNATSLLTVVVPARDPGGLPGRIADATDRLLAAIGAPASARRREVRRMAELRVAPTNSRAVLGSMAALAQQAHWELLELSYRPGRTLDHVNVWLAGQPCRPLGLRPPADEALRLLRAVTRSARRTLPATQR
jgi:hypothetical protein